MLPIYPASPPLPNISPMARHNHQATLIASIAISIIYFVGLVAIVFYEYFKDLSKPDIELPPLDQRVVPLNAESPAISMESVLRIQIPSLHGVNHLVIDLQQVNMHQLLHVMRKFHQNSLPFVPNPRADQLLLERNPLLKLQEDYFFPSFNQIQEEEMNDFANADDINPEEFELQRIIASFNDHQKPLKSGDIKTLMEKWAEQQPHLPLLWLGEVLFPNILEKIAKDKDSFQQFLNEQISVKVAEAWEKNISVFFIPIILQSCLYPLQFMFPAFNDHIVLLAIDLVEGQFEYYDSKGEKIENETRIILGTQHVDNGLTPSGITVCLQKALRACPEIPNEAFQRVISNGKSHQIDSVNCGAFVSWFMFHRRKYPFRDLCGYNPNPLQFRAESAGLLRLLLEKKDREETEEKIMVYTQETKDALKQIGSDIERGFSIQLNDHQQLQESLENEVEQLFGARNDDDEYIKEKAKLFLSNLHQGTLAHPTLAIRKLFQSYLGDSVDAKRAENGLVHTHGNIPKELNDDFSVTFSTIFDVFRTLQHGDLILLFQIDIQYTVFPETGMTNLKWQFAASKPPIDQ